MSKELQARLASLETALDSLLPASNPSTRAEAAGVMLDLAQVQDELGMADEEHQTLLRLIAEFESDTHPDAVWSVCAALRTAAINCYRRDALDEATRYNNILRGHAEHNDSRVRRQVIRGLLAYTGYLSDQGQHDAELTVYDTIITLFGDDPAVAVREYLASAIFDKAVTLDQRGDSAGENATYRTLIQLMAKDSNEAVLVHVCKAHVNLLFNTLREGDYAEALAHCEATLALAGQKRHAGLQDQVARALFGAARVHDSQANHDKEQAALDDLIRRLDGSPFSVCKVNIANALNRKGRGLEADFSDPHAAIQCYQQVVERYGDTPLDFDGDPSDGWEVRQHRALVRQLAQALYYAADAYCDLKDYDQSRSLIVGLEQAFGRTQDADLLEILADAHELTLRIDKHSGRKNYLKDLFGRFGPTGSSGNRTH